MQSGGIPNSQITASSFDSSSFEPYMGRLYGPTAWMAANAVAGEYLQIDIGTTKTITKVSTQGRQDRGMMYVIRFQLALSDAGTTYSTYQHNGQTVVSGFL